MSQDRLAVLQDFFSEEGIARIQRFEADLGNVATVEDFLSVYYAVDSLEYPNLPDTMDAIYPFVNADLGIPGVMSSCEADCTEPSFDRNMDTFAAAAAKTPSEQVASIQERTDLFSEDLETARSTLFNDMAGYNMCFGPTRDAVRAELLVVRGLDWVSEEERSTIDKRLRLVDGTCIDCGERELETDCESQSCSCASG
jgi:hypothetical protein